MLEDFRLRVFVTVARLGSFTRAAKELGVTQPAVSQNISELEKNLGVQLFLRTRTSVTLTAAGMTFHEYATRILGSYSSLSSFFGEQGRRGNRAPVRIAAGTAAATSFLPILCAGFRSASPGTAVRVVAEDERDYDVKVTLSPSSGDTLFSSAEGAVARVDATVVSSALAYSRIRDLEMLPSDASLAVWTPYAALLPLNARAKVVLESEYSEILIHAAQKDPSLVAVVPSVPSAGGGLMVLPVSLPQCCMSVHMEPSASFKSDPLYKLLVLIASGR